MYIFDWIFGKEKKKKRVFISFAIEDRKYRDFLVQQSKNERSPFDFIDMSVKKRWSQDIWKVRCREKIKRCDGVIALISDNTYHARGARWEIKCAREEKIKIIGMQVKQNNPGLIPPELKGEKVINWSWRNLEKFIESL